MYVCCLDNVMALVIGLLSCSNFFFLYRAVIFCLGSIRKYPGGLKMCKSQKKTIQLPLCVSLIVPPKNVQPLQSREDCSCSFESTQAELGAQFH